MKEVSQAMEAWIALDRLAALTGWFGDNQLFVSQLARRTRAIGQMPLALWLNTYMPHSRKWHTFTMPNYFLFFGFYTRMRIPHPYKNIVPNGWEFGEDFKNEDVTPDALPQWPNNDRGSVFVPSHGQIRMKNVDWNRWACNIFQQPLWMGTSTPGRGSQARQMQRRRWNN